MIIVSLQNLTIKEWVSLLEMQVVEIEEDVSGLSVDLTEVERDVNFLFDEQIIQDEKLFDLEETSDQVVVELTKVNANIQGRKFEFVPYLIFVLIWTQLMHNFSYFFSLAQIFDFRVTALEENGGGDGDSSVAGLEIFLWKLLYFWDCRILCHVVFSIYLFCFPLISSLQVMDMDHDARISALKENGGSSGSQNGSLSSFQNIVKLWQKHMLYYCFSTEIQWQHSKQITVKMWFISINLDIMFYFYFPSRHHCLPFSFNLLFNHPCWIKRHIQWGFTEWRRRVCFDNIMRT